MPDFLFPHQSQDSLACFDQDSLSFREVITEADVLITAAIATRPAREPDLAAENQALRTLAQHLTEQPQVLLKTLVNLALDLCQADSVGVSLLETSANGKQVFRWVAIAGTLADCENTTIPGNFSPCGTTLGYKQPHLYQYPERYFTYLAHPQLPMVEALVIPLRDKEYPLGTLWIITHSDQRRFDAEDQRLMMSLGGFTASALATIQQLQRQTRIALEQEHEARTQYQRSQVALSESKELNQQILDSSDDCIKVLDLDGRILYMSPGGQALLRIADLTLLADISWVQLWPELERQTALNAIAQAKLGKTTSFRGYCPNFAGEPKWWDNKISPIRGANQQIERLLCISRDITESHTSELERQQIEADLLASEERYRAIINQAVTGVAYTDLDGFLILVNQKYCEITGYSASELSQLRMQDFTHPDDLPRNLELYNQMIVDGTPFEIEKRYIRKDGSIVWVNNSVYPLCNAQGDIESIVAISLDITNRKQAEADLRAAQESLTIAVEAAEMGIWYLDLTQDVSSQRSLRHDQIFGYETLQTEWGQAIAKRHVIPEDHPIFDAAFARALETGELDFEVRIQWPDNSIHWMAARGRFYFDDNGQPLYGGGVNFDITKNKQQEFQLRDSKERYRTLFNSIDEGFCIIEVLFNEQGTAYDYRFLEINPAFEKHTGLEDALGKTILELAPNHETYWFEIYGEVAQTGSPAKFERPAQELGRFYEVYAFRVGEPQEHKVAILFNDITDRKQVEREREQLLVNERLYATQLQGLTTAALAINSALAVEDVIRVITDQAALIIGAHQAVTSMTIDQNWTQAINAIYLSDKYAQWRDFQAEPDGSGIYSCVCHLNQPMRLTQAELEAHPRWNKFGKAADQHPPLRGWLAAPLMGRNGHNIGLIQLSDKYDGDFSVSDESILIQLAQMASVAVENARLYEAEQQARSLAEAAREEAQAANRVKDEFLAVLSHELRSPLNPILGWSTLLLTRNLDTAKTTQALTTIQRNARLQSELIEDLLDVSRILQGKLSLNIAPVNLGSILKAAMETVRLAAVAKSIQLEANLNPNVALVSGDATRLQQVVWNLLSNAVKFTPEGGQVKIDLDQEGTQAQITISDTGQGIEPDFLPYVFDYFRQANAATTRKFGGLGLGLAIVRHLVELHGGRVQAHSLGEGQGATFIVRLPLMLTSSSSNVDSLLPQSWMNLDQVKILIVDDEADTRDFIAFLLEQQGAQITAVGSAYEALTVLTQSQPDVLLSDIGMPDMDGYMLIKQVRALLPEQGSQIPAIALTAYAGEINQQQVIAAGFQKHISKPIEPEALIQAIANLVRKQP